MPALNLIAIVGTTIIAISRTVTVRICEIIAVFQTISTSVPIDILIGYTASTDALIHFIAVIGTSVIAISGSITIGIFEVITDLFAIDDAIVISVLVGHATSTLSGINLVRVIHASIPAIQSTITIGVYIGNATPTFARNNLVRIVRA